MDAINLEQKTISIKHRVIEDTVDGKSIAVGEDALKTKSSLTDHFSWVLEKADLKKIRFHDLRHYCASFLHALGVPDMYTMARGGWQSRETLERVYTHALEKQKKEFNQDINNKLTESLFAGK